MDISRKITFIGAGRMGGALIKGLLRCGVPTDLIAAADSDSERLDELREQYDIKTFTSNKEAAYAADILILAVKPQQIAAVLEDVKEALSPNNLVITIAAGVTTRAVENKLAPGVPVIRAMPNSAAFVKAAMSVLSAGANATGEDMALARQIFDDMGKTAIVDEEAQNTVTALSGSGPAYFYLFVEALAEAGEEAGLDWDTAFDLAHETMFGASRMLKMRGKKPQELIDEVMSPGGTTEAAFDVFNESDLKGLVKKAFMAARARAGELELKD